MRFLLFIIFFADFIGKEVREFRLVKRIIFPLEALKNLTDDLLLECGPVRVGKADAEVRLVLADA